MNIYYTVRGLFATALILSFYSAATDKFVVAIVGISLGQIAIFLGVLFWARLDKMINKIWDEAKPKNQFHRSEPYTGPTIIPEMVAVSGLICSIIMVHVPTRDWHGDLVTHYSSPTIAEKFWWLLLVVTIVPSGIVLVWRALHARQNKRTVH